MQSSKALLRGGTSVFPATFGSSEIRRCPTAAKKTNAVVFGGGSFPFRPPAAASAAPTRTLTHSEVSTRAVSKYDSSLSLSSSAEGTQRRRRRFFLCRRSHGQKEPSALPSASQSASALAPTPRHNSVGGLAAAPAALRASDSDDPSDDDDPASELTAEELAMAMADDVPPPPAYEDEEEEEDEGAWDDDGTAAASASANSAEGDDADDARALAIELALVASGVKASDVVVLHVAPLVYWTSYMVLCTVFSRPQLGAVLAKAEEAAASERFGRDLGGARSAGRSPWEVLDFGDVVMHCFTPDQREFYDLEGFYGAAEEVELPSGVGGASLGGGKRDASSWARRA